MNSQNQSNVPQLSDIFPLDISKTPSNTNSKYEPQFHSSQIKRPVIHFDGSNQNIFDTNNNSDISQSFNSNNYNCSKISKNQFIEGLKSNNIFNDNENTLYIKKSVQQEKYDAIKNYCLKKNDSDNYPLISYDNYLLIDSLYEKNTPEFEPYKNFLFNKNASIELYSKFCTLLMNRYILSNQFNNCKKYPKVVYQVIFNVKNIYNYLSPDIVADAKQSNMFVALVKYHSKWNVLIINQNNNYSNYFMFNKYMDKEIILSLMNTITQIIYPYHKFEYNVYDYSGINSYNQIILPFIIMDFYSRYKNILPVDDEDFYYQTILILSEIMTNNLITK
jgi:hypothetical protein